MPTLATLRALVKSTINSFSNETIQLYRVSSVANNVYSRGAVTYSSPSSLRCTIITQFEKDKMTHVGRLNQDERVFVISVQEGLDVVTSVTDPNLLVREQDAIKHDGKKYGVTEVRLEGRVFGGPTTIHIKCRENPDLVLP